MSVTDRTLREESVRQHCRLLRMPTVAAQFIRLAEEAIQQQYGPVRYLEALLAAELEERERSAIARRISPSSSAAVPGTSATSASAIKPPVSAHAFRK